MDSRCARAAYNHETEMQEVVWERKKKEIGLVRRVSVVIDEIAAHPTDFTELFILVSIERFECRPIEIDERVVVQKIVLVVLRVGVECGTLR